ncbi:MAG: hypothetical protein MRT15_10340 [archaeon YNP-LCB-003-016]|jgi:hypothetical protein|uniref:hypothetical protein n=1 Tax=Candidatus Culexarchaeum yellowstonense TaxID=2928963 RepID=UPI0026EB6AC2|nr:hypothetical protein [Candidatus Culexarchaeum yellowstonense]MCR6692781.1 hypothetical protein [Candidatus Culexarchaeum yellowstonense]
MLKEYEDSLLDLFGRFYRQIGSFQDQDGNVYLVFERRRFKLFRERVILRRELLEEKESKLPGSTLYIPKLKNKLKL